MRWPLKRPLSLARPTNGPPPTPAPLITEYIKQGLTTIHPQTLAASTSAIASSLALPPCDPTDTAPDELGSSQGSYLGTAYEAVKFAVDIANASSDSFLPLKAVVGALSVLMKNYDQTADNADQMRELEERVQSLGEILASPVGDRDDKENARRNVLRKKLAMVIAELRPLSKPNGFVRFLKSANNAKILNGFVKTLATAVMEYQTSMQQEIYEKTKKIDEGVQYIIETTDLVLLEKLNPVDDAGYQAGHHNACLPGTRESVLDGVMRWTKNPQKMHVFWLNGMAGTGKSTIAQTFSAMAEDARTLGASFFCSRDYIDRKKLKNIFPTIAYQLACRYPAFRYTIIQAIKRNPSVVAQNSLIYQLEKLIVEPLSSTNISCVIVVDALDECDDAEPASAILSVLGRYVKAIPLVRFFITGRPEPRIRTGFRLISLEPITQIFFLHKVEPSNIDKDIRLYLQEKLIEVAKRRNDFNVSNPWPCDQDLTTLTKKSSGLFIFASTLVRFIESEHHIPKTRLQLIITSSDSTVHEGGAGIDPLYTQILEHAFLGTKDATVFEDLRKILGTVALAFNPLSCEGISKILGVEVPLIANTLRHLHSVLLVPTEDFKEIRVLHKSFPDFLQDRNRCSDPKFHIDTTTHHFDMALGCLELLKQLKPNPCNLPDFVMNLDVPNLPKLLEDEVGSSMRYACSHWATHVRYSPTTGDYALQLIASATKFFNSHAIQWIEVMSLENRLESVIHSIHNIFDWIGKVDVSASNLRNLAEDHLRFTKNFFHLVQQSAMHIYHSALPLSPRSSTFHPMISQEKALITGFYGRRETWGAVEQTIQGGSGSFTCMTTFGRWIAVACPDGVMIYDAASGASRLSLTPVNPVKAVRGSPDGSVLFCAHLDNSITLWDIQTGGLIRTFIPMEEVQAIAVSLEGRFLACGFPNGFEVWEVAKEVEDVVKEVAEVVEDAVMRGVSPVTHFCWLEPEEQLVIAWGALVDILDVVAGTKLRSFTVANFISGVAYSQELNRLAVTTRSPSRDAVTIIDPQTGVPSDLSGVQERLSCFAFSPTTKELMRATWNGGLEVFSFSTWRWRRLKYQDTVTFVSSLPNGIVVAKFLRSGIQLLNLDNGYASSPRFTSVLDVRTPDEGRIIAIIPTTRGHIQLLETSTMYKLFTIPIRGAPTDPIDFLALSASLENRMAVYCFKEGGSEHLRLHMFDDEYPKWSVKINRLPWGSGISPGGNRIVTFHTEEPATRIRVWDTRGGRLQAEFLIDQFYPLSPDITFDSETLFHSHHCNYRIPYDLTLSPGVTIISRERVVESRQYEVDSGHEWVVSGSERICWIPPGYIRSTRGGYHWAGSDTLVMVGEDGTLRKLTFRSQELSL